MFTTEVKPTRSICLITYDTQLKTAAHLPISVQFGKVRKGSVSYQQLDSL